MSFETLQMGGDQKISPDQSGKNDSLEYTNKIKAIRLSLENREGDIKELDKSFVELWKSMPKKVDDTVYEDIDAIRDLLMIRYEENQY